MITMYFISLFICSAYVAFVKIKFNVTSISQSYYKFSESINKGWLFSGWAIATAMSLMPLWLDITPTNFQFVAFLSCASLIVVGLSPKYLTNQTLQHYIGAGVCVALAILWSILIGLWYIPLILLISLVFSILIFWKNKDYIYWVEVWALGSLYLSILLTIL